MPDQPIIDESKIFDIDPLTVKVTDARPRQRKEMGEIQKMVESIRTFGQLQPIVINRNNELIAGGRRLAACLLGGFKARVCYKDTVDDLTMREMELEENVQRKALTPAEEALAVRELVELKRKIHGTPVQGKEGGFTLENAAELLGKSKAYVLKAISVAEAIDAFPDLAKCDTTSEIQKTYKGLERIKTNLDALESYEKSIKRTDKFVLVNRNAVDWLKGIGDQSVDLVFTDPPYGIDIHEVSMTLGGKTGGDTTTTGVKYDDSEEYAKKLLETIAKESYRITKPNGFALIFCAPSHFTWISQVMSINDWLVAPRPVVWIKRESGQNNNPDKWFSAAYEFILFARKIDSQIILPGRPDWIQCDPVNPSERLHQAEKPVALCKELISRLCLPGSYIADPCMGSGAIIEAAVQMKMHGLGCELDTAIYAGAVARMNKLVEE